MTERMEPAGTDPAALQHSEEAQERLTLAEQRGLSLAIGCRTLITAAAFAWYLGTAFLFPESTTRAITTLVLLGFTAIGAAHLLVIGTRFDRLWMKYTVYALDTLSICALFAAVPISRADDVPQIIAFRAYGIYYLFPLIALACLSLSWRLVLWTGTLAVIGWWAAFLWVSVPMENTLSWSDIPSTATREMYEQVFLSIDFIGRGNRIEETAMLFFATLALSLAVYRARSVFFAQVTADIEWRRERAARERVSNLFGKYVPQEIAQSLIADEAPLKPQRCHGTALIMDIAGFTEFSAQYDPNDVIDRLDKFLADATGAVTAEKGVVISYLGDGFLVTFNAPVAVQVPEAAAVRAAFALQPIAVAHEFSIRIGIASGDLVTGTIGSDTRKSFTVYGDAVNLAARLEGQCKALDADILVDAATQAALDNRKPFKPMGSIPIKGLEQPVDVFGFKPD